MNDRTSAAHRGTRAACTSYMWVFASVLIGIAWIGLRLLSVPGGPTVLLSDGPDSPAHELAARDFDDPYDAGEAGFDGVQFYAIAKSHLDVNEAAEHVYPPTYRIRRIFYPAVAGILAPGGGIPLIWALAFVSLVGVAIGARALARLPGAPQWLPLTMVLNPGVIAGLWLSLGDVLATGLVLAAFATMFSRRIALAIVLLALACLTREISILAAFALALTPGLTKPQRAMVAVVPCVPVGLWSLYVAHAAGAPLLAQPDGGTFTVPFWGWINNGSSIEEMVMAVALAVLLTAAVAKWRMTPLPVTVYVGCSLLVLVSSAPVIMDTWLGSTRVITAALPLAVWALVGRRSPDRTALSPVAFKARHEPTAAT